jgi:serine/threonine-protein kinase
LPIQPGTKLGQYEVQDFIGQGAMGLVYRAYHQQLERTGAVKVLQAIAPDADTTARFRHEAQAIAQLRHPNIVNVYDFGEYLGTPYMIVEYVPGGSLADRLNEGRIDPVAALKYLRGIASGLDYAHGVGIIHRDVKPANVLLEKDNTPVLADFGLAKLVQGSSLKSMTGVTTGTPAYMAPEQVTGSKVGPAADRYSLATIAYEMFAGAIPFDGEGLMELLYAHVHRDPDPPSSLNSSLSPQVDAVILRGMAREPAARWESCTAFVDALAAALAGKTEPVAARTMVMTQGIASTLPLAGPVAAAAVAVPKLTDRVNPSATVAIPWPAPAEPVAKPRSRRRLIAAGVAAALVLLLIVGVVWFAATRATPTLSLSASTVAAGDSVVVTATHVPANQNGTIQLFSAVRSFPFRADAHGDVSTDITVPRDTGAGDHIVRICWVSSCHASATLHVVEPGTLGTPSPGTTPPTTPGASPRPTSTPGQSPVPTAGASPKPGTSPPPPTPAATPTPPPPAPSITLLSVSVASGTRVTFYNFSAGTIAVCVWQNGSCHTTSVAVPQGTNTVTFTTPTGILPLLGQAHVIVNSLTSNPVNVTA